MKNYLGIDVGGMSIKGGIVDGNGKILYKTTCPGTNNLPLLSLENVVNDIKSFCKSQDISLAKCGIGVPCIFDNKTGVVSYGNNLDFKGVSLKELFKEKYDLDLFISNDAAAAALGEVKFGGAKGYKNSCLITIGTGIGCGIILDGKIIESNSSAVGELSHTIVNVGGRKCSCGNYGCLEAYCSMTALYKDIKRTMLHDKKSSLWQKIDINDINGKVFFDLIGKNNEADIIYNRFIKYLSIGVLNVANLIRPDIILIGGGVSSQGDILIKPLNEFLKKHLFAKEFTKKIPVKSALNGNDAGIIGAASLAM